MLVFIFIKNICFKLWPPSGSNLDSIYALLSQFLLRQGSIYALLSQFLLRQDSIFALLFQFLLRQDSIYAIYALLSQFLLRQDSIYALLSQFLLRLPWLRSYIRPNILLLLRVDFLNRLTIVNLRLCKRFKSLDELPISLKAMDANNTISLEWIIAGSNWKLSKQLECFGSSKLLQKNPTGNPRKKLIKVSLSLSLSLSKFDRTGFSGP